MRVTIREVESTVCFVGSAEHPLQVARVRLSATGATGAAGVASITIAGGSITTPFPAMLPGGSDAGARDGDVVVEVGVHGYDAHPPGSPVPVTLTVSDGSDTYTHDTVLITAEPGWTMWMVPHFHYDPVWWNTQAAYAERWDDLPDAQTQRAAYQQTVFSLVRAYLEATRLDPDYRLVLAEVDYLKPYWDTHPEDRPYLRRLLTEGRLEIVGGTYNEPNTNLTSPESTARNAVYGVGFQRDVMGATPDTAWQLDVFGHDPQFPGMMSDAGLSTSSWARGPFHQWGPILNPGGERKDPRRMQFASEFRWLSPSGRGLLTSYMADHYSIGYWMDSAPTLTDAENEVYKIFCELHSIAATRNVLLPVGTDHSRPNKWVTEIARDWCRRYVWPRFVCATPREFFAAVRAESAGGATLWPQTRDMNPVYTGKDVSYIDIKQAQRVAENTLLDAEKFATLASLLTGAPYPDAATDKAWRQLIFGAHHDGITGSFSDQVYIDLLAGWREAHDLAKSVQDAALDALAAHVDTRFPGDPAARPLVVFNALSWPRTDLVTVRMTFPEPGGRSVEVYDATPDCADPPNHDANSRSHPVAAVAESVTRHRDGSLAGGTLTFLAQNVPGIGYKTYWVRRSDIPLPTWTPEPGSAAHSDSFAVTLDEERGGGLTSLVERTTGRELIPAGQVGNEFRLYDEHSAHPQFGEGPWHLLPSGPVRTSADSPATVAVETAPIGQRVTATARLGSLTYTTRLLLANGTGRADVSTTVDGFIGADQLLRMRLPCDLPGALPVSEVGYAVVGRGFALPDVDTAHAPWTLDNPAYTWFGLGSTARVQIGQTARAIGVAEVVVPDRVASGGGADDLVRALARVGVTSTCSTPERERYGALDIDSNLPDTRIAVGGPETNAFTAEVLTAADPTYARELTRQLDATGTARVWVPALRRLADVWVPNADLRAARDLPVLVVAGRDDATTAAAVAALVDDLGDAAIDVAQDPDLSTAPDGEPSATDHTVAVLNRGIPGFAVDPTGALHLSLFRSCTGWPSGVWIDPPKRATPDGSGFQLQHWSHTFEYALVSGAGDWRQAGVVHHGQSYNHPLVAKVADQHAGRLPARATLVEVRPDTAVLATLKPTGTPLARGSARSSTPADGVSLRLYETHGGARHARLGGMVSLRDLTPANLLEEPSGPVGCDILLDGADIATVLARPDLPSPGSDDDQPLVERYERANPVFARYWLHNKGPAPMGNVPLAVHLHPGEIVTAGEFTVRVTVASDLPDATQHALVWLDVPSGWSAEPAQRPVTLAPGGFVEYDVLVRPPSDVSDAKYLVAARAQGADGQWIEDVTTVCVGRAGTAYGQELVAEMDVHGVVVSPGERVEVPVIVRNGFASDVAVEAQVVSPWGTWHLVGAEPAAGDSTSPAHGPHPAKTREPTDTGEAIQADEPTEATGPTEASEPTGRTQAGEAGRTGVSGEANEPNDGDASTAPEARQARRSRRHTRPVRSASIGATLRPRERRRLSFVVDAPVDTPPGSYWLLVKVMYAGRVAYTETVPFEVAER